MAGDPISSLVWTWANIERYPLPSACCSYWRLGGYQVRRPIVRCCKWQMNRLVLLILPLLTLGGKREKERRVDKTCGTDCEDGRYPPRRRVERGMSGEMCPDIVSD